MNSASTTPEPIVITNEFDTLVQFSREKKEEVVVHANDIVRYVSIGDQVGLNETMEHLTALMGQNTAMAILKFLGFRCVDNDIYEIHTTRSIIRERVEALEGYLFSNIHRSFGEADPRINRATVSGGGRGNREFMEAAYIEAMGEADMIELLMRQIRERVVGVRGPKRSRW